MVKKGEYRSSKFSAKYDPFVNMLRIKKIGSMAKLNFVEASQQHAYVDENLQEWLTEVSLKFGEKGSLFDFVRKVVWSWTTITDDTKIILHTQWLSKGLPESLWLKIEAKANEITSFYKTHSSHNIIVTYETDVFPYPQENIDALNEIRDDINLARYMTKLGEDYLTVDDIFPVPNEAYTQNFWRQKSVKYGSVDFYTDWCERGMDKYPTITLTIETVQPLLYEKSVSISAFLTEPYQSPLDKSPILETSYEVENGSEDSVSKSTIVQSSEVNSTLAAPSKTSGINTSYTTEVT